MSNLDVTLTTFWQFARHGKMGTKPNLNYILKLETLTLIHQRWIISRFVFLNPSLTRHCLPALVRPKNRNQNLHQTLSPLLPPTGFKYGGWGG